MSQPNPHIARAIAILRSSAALAELLDHSQMDVLNMLDGQPVSGEAAVAIDHATLGQVSQHDLRPDLFPNPLDEGWQGAGRIVATDAPMAKLANSGPGRVLRIARVEYAAGETRVFLSDGSELGGVQRCSVSVWDMTEPVTVELVAEIAG